MLNNVQIVLVHTRFPENIGMAARACANMGVENISLVNPELWATNGNLNGETYVTKAKNLATSAGLALIEQIKTVPSLSEAVANSTICIGTTARTGGWRQGILTPAQAAQTAWQHLEQGGRVAFVFGAEDKGLENSDIELCTHLVCIPTALPAASLNLAQAVLIMLYELRKGMSEQINNSTHPQHLTRSQTQKHPNEQEQQGYLGQITCPAQPPLTEYSPRQARQGRVKYSPLVSIEQQELLINNIKQAMQAIDSLPEANSNYFLRPIRRFVTRSQIRHNEFSMLMGICNKILRLSKIDPANTKQSTPNFELQAENTGKITTKPSPAASPKPAPEREFNHFNHPKPTREC